MTLVVVDDVYLVAHHHCCMPLAAIPTLSLLFEVLRVRILRGDLSPFVLRHFALDDDVAVRLVQVLDGRRQPICALPKHAFVSGWVDSVDLRSHVPLKKLT